MIFSPDSECVPGAAYMNKAAHHRAGELHAVSAITHEQAAAGCTCNLPPSTPIYNPDAWFRFKSTHGMNRANNHIEKNDNGAEINRAPVPLTLPPTATPTRSFAAAGIRHEERASDELLCSTAPDSLSSSRDAAFEGRAPHHTSRHIQTEKENR